MTSIATVRGVALAPGVSRNGRYYSPEIIADAVRRGQARIDEGTAPLTMLTSHGAGDDSTHIVGRVTSLRVAEDGSALFEAELANTDHGRTIAALVAGQRPFLRGVSIRGAWVGNITRVNVGGASAETAEGLALDGLDWTKDPGVPAAGITGFERTATETRTRPRALIYESAPRVMLVDEALPQVDLREVAALDLDRFRQEVSRPWLARHATRNPSPFWNGFGGGGDAA